MGCSTSSTNAVRNLDPEMEATANTPMAASNMKERIVNGKSVKNGARKVSKSSINTLENNQPLAGSTAENQTNGDDANKIERFSLSSSPSSDSDLDYSDIVDTEHGKQHRRKAGPQATPNSNNNDNSNKKPKMSDEEVDIDLNDPEVGKAAVKIQAGFKSFMAAKKKKEPEPKEEEPIEDKLADIDLNDPDVEKAATKIQATFRGYKTRKDHQIEAK